MTVFRKFSEDDIVRANPTEVTTGLWTGGTGSLAAFFTSSTQVAASGEHYYDVYDIDPSSSLAEVQFAVTYGNIDGGGAPTLTVDDNSLLSTMAIYAQHRNILLQPDDANFTFANDSDGNQFDADEIFVINVKRQRLKEKLDPGNWLLTLSTTVNGTDETRTFIDDSGQTLGESFGSSGRVFNIVSGSLTGVSGSTTAEETSVSGGFGLCYPDLGLLVLNPRALYAVSASAVTDVDTDTHKYNHQVLLTAMASGSDFQARSAEHVASTHYFVRLPNKQFNYSNNPSFFNETNGVIVNSNFINDPQVFVSSVGLYNDEGELLAIGKLSQPTRKSFDRELLLRVRLDF